MNPAVSPTTNSEIDFTIKRSKRKSVAIHVSKDYVEVRAPHATPKWFIEEFVQEKHQWILQRLIEQNEKQLEIHQIKDGAKIPFLGATLEINIEERKRNSSKLIGNQLNLSVSNSTQENLIKVMDKWLIKQAKIEITPIVDIFVEEMQLQHKFTQLKFRKTKTKWGHCTHDGIVQLNPLILMAPEFVLKYLIIHELCHLIHQNHSKNYWNLVVLHDPDYKAAEKWLKHNGHKLWYQ